MPIYSGLEGHWFRNWIRVCFLIEPSLKSSPDDEMLPSFKRGSNTPIQIRSRILKPSFAEYFGEALQFEATVPQLRTFHTDLHPSNTSPTKNSNNRFLGYVTFECHANVHINREPFAHKEKLSVYSDMLPLTHGGDKCRVLVRGPVPL
jgi:hypothetical protein